MLILPLAGPQQAILPEGEGRRGKAAVSRGPPRSIGPEGVETGEWYLTPAGFVRSDVGLERRFPSISNFNTFSVGRFE